MNDRQWAFDEVARLQAENASLRAVITGLHNLADKDGQACDDGLVVCLDLIRMLSDPKNVEEAIGS